VVTMAEGEGFEPILPSFDNRSAEGFEPFREFARITFTSPSSIPLYERTHPTAIVHEIGREHSNPPELGAWIDPSNEASLATAPVTLQMDIRVGFATFVRGAPAQRCTVLKSNDLCDQLRSGSVCKSRSLPLTPNLALSRRTSLVYCTAPRQPPVGGPEA
jgi:hypothetical protein